MNGVAESRMQRASRRAHYLLPNTGDVGEEHNLVESLSVRRLQALAEHIFQVAHEPRSDHFILRLDLIHSRCF